MSIERKETVTCPECGNVQDFIVWQTLNGDLDPEAKQQLLNGTLFRFECSKCGHKSNVNYGMLYHDMTHQAMVYYVDEDSVEQTIKAMYDVEEKIKAKFDVEEKIGVQKSGYRKRVVTNQNALREKAIIFEHELDDRVIEIIKLFCLASASEQFPEANSKEAYFFVNDGEYMLEFICDRPFGAKVSASMYDSIKADFAERLEAAGNDEPIVNSAWALEFLEG